MSKYVEHTHDIECLGGVWCTALPQVGELIQIHKDQAPHLSQPTKPVNFKCMIVFLLYDLSSWGLIPVSFCT